MGNENLNRTDRGYQPKPPASFRIEASSDVIHFYPASDSPKPPIGGSDIQPPGSISAAKIKLGIVSVDECSAGFRRAAQAIRNAGITAMNNPNPPPPGPPPVSQTVPRKRVGFDTRFCSICGAELFYLARGLIVRSPRGSGYSQCSACCEHAPLPAGPIITDYDVSTKSATLLIEQATASEPVMSQRGIVCQVFLNWLPFALYILAVFAPSLVAVMIYGW